MRTLIFYVFVVALVATAAVQAQAPAGGEFRVNNATSVMQAFPHVAADGSGRFVVVWRTLYGGVRVRRFDPSGTPLGTEFNANTLPSFAVESTGVSADDKGRFVVAWNGFDGYDQGIVVRRFDTFARAQSGQYRVNAYTTGTQDDPAVAMLAGGGFVVVWKGALGDGSADGIFAQVFDSAGQATAPLDLRVNTYTTGNQFEPSVVAGEGNRFVIAWTSYDQDGALSGVYAQRYDGRTPLGAEFRVNSYTTGRQYAPIAVRGPQSSFVVLWQGEPGSVPTQWGRRFDATGVPQGAEFVANTFTTPPFLANASADSLGDFAVAWDTAAFQVVGRRFDPAGVPRGSVFQVNTYTTHLGVPISNIGSDGSGNLLVTWMSDQFSPGQFNIFGQRFGGLVPAAMTVSDGGNGVLEVPDDFALVTSWRNANGAPQTFQGQAGSVVAPSGLLLTLSATANYGTVPNGAVGACTGQCFAGGLTGTRPGGHVDIGFVERILPDVQGQAKRWSVHVGGSFTDVPRASAFYRFVETLLHHGVTGGCGANAYCPSSVTTREQMAVLVLGAKEGPAYAPAACATPLFDDVPLSSPFCRWIHELVARSVVSGCGGNNFCPSAAVTREQMAVFVLRTLDSQLSPPACTTPVFGDVPASSPFCRWIEELARRGVVSGCGGGNYCPSAAVTREQMAVFLTGTFGLTLYGP